MKSKLIQTDKSELAIFAKTYQTLTGFTVDMNYLEKAKVRAFYNADNEIIGGYAVSTADYNPDLRYLSFLGDKQQSILKKKGIRKEELSEITYTFFNRHKAKRFQRIMILTYSMIEAIRAKKKYIMGGGIVTRFNDRMKQVLQYELFEGTVEVYGKNRQFTILYADSNTALWNLITGFFNEITQWFLRVFRK